MKSLIKKLSFYPISVFSAIKVGDGTKRSLDDFVYETIGHSTFYKSIAHRGYSLEAPENTLEAIKLAKKYGFDAVELDIAFTSDGVPVLLHDTTIDRTSDGTGAISEMTYEQVSVYDFGSWKSEKYIGVKIPTLVETIVLCKKLGIEPYLELKGAVTYTTEQVQEMVNIIKKYGLLGHVTWISFSVDHLNKVKFADPTARIGYLSGTISTERITTALSLKLDTNEVFIDANYINLTDELVQLCVDNNLPLEVYTVNTESDIYILPEYVSGMTSDGLNIGKLLIKKNM